MAKRAAPKSRIRHLTTRVNASGAVRYYWQPSPKLRCAGFRVVRLSNDRATAVSEAEVLNRRADAWRRGDEQDGRQKGTVSAMIADYRKSRFYAKLAPKTQTGYETYLRIIEKWAGDQPVFAIRAPDMEALYAAHLATGKRTAAARLMATVQAVWKAGARLGHLDPERNPARQMGIEKTKPVPRMWSREAVAAVIAAADAADHHSVGTAVLLNEWIGQRPADLLSAQRHAVVDGELRIIQQKTGAQVALPIGIVPQLVVRLDAELQRQRTRRVESVWLIVDEATSAPYSVESFRDAFILVRDAAITKAHADGKPQLADELLTLEFRHLRHTAVTRLADAEVETLGIAAITGHTPKSVHQILDHYWVRTAKQARAALRRRVAAEQGDLL